MKQSLRRPPGPKGHFIVGSLPERRNEPLKLYLEGALKHGDIVYYKMGPVDVYLLNNPEHIKHVLQDNQRNYFKGKGYDKLFPVLGNGLLLSDGDFWHRQRKLSQPAFHRQRLIGFSKTMTDATAEMLERWKKHPAGETLDVAKEMMRLTLAIVSRTLLSTDVSDDADNVGAALTRLLAETNDRLLSIFPWEKVPSPRNSRFKKDLETLDSVVFRVIEERRRTGQDTGDLLSMLMQTRDEETGESMNDRQLRDEVMTIFLAGHETTATLLSWAFVLLSRNPHVARKLAAEAKEICAGGRTPTFEDLPRLRYTQMVIDETLRLYPPAWVLARENKADDEIGGYTIPAGSIIVLSPYVVHRLPHLWDNPEGFDPERFSPEHAGAPRHKFSYFPFSGGPRVCIGNNFAIMEAQLILAMITSRYRLDLVPGFPIEPEALITLRPKHGVGVTLHQA